MCLEFAKWKDVEGNVWSGVEWALIYLKDVVEWELEVYETTPL